MTGTVFTRNILVQSYFCAITYKLYKRYKSVRIKNTRDTNHVRLTMCDEFSIENVGKKIRIQVI